MSGFAARHAAGKTVLRYSGRCTVPKPKKQHYVPQFLLRNFSVGHKRKAKLWVLDKLKGEIYLSSVRDAGHENLFYEYHGEFGEVEREDLMQKLDSQCAQVISTIIRCGRLSNDPESRVWLSYFVAAQMMRTPMTRNEMENIRQLVIHKWGAGLRVRQDDPKTIGEYGPEDAKLSSLQILRDVPKFAKLLQGKVWCLCRAPRTMPYIISDNPVTRHNMLDRWPRGNLGLLNKGIEVYMPLSSKYMIHAICPELATDALSTPELAAQFERAIESGTPIDYEPKHVEFVNSLQVIWAERFVFSRNRQGLEMPLDMLRTNPELKDGPGVRQKPEAV